MNMFIAKTFSIPFQSFLFYLLQKLLSKENLQTLKTVQQIFYKTEACCALATGFRNIANFISRKRKKAFFTQPAFGCDRLLKK